MHVQPTQSILCATACNIPLLLENKAKYLFIREIPWKPDCQEQDGFSVCHKRPCHERQKK